MFKMHILVLLCSLTVFVETIRHNYAHPIYIPPRFWTSAWQISFPLNWAVSANGRHILGHIHEFWSGVEVAGGGSETGGCVRNLLERSQLRVKRQVFWMLFF
jgi:hypothetical protein